MKEQYTNDPEALLKENLELKKLIREMNSGNSHDLGGSAFGNGCLIIYPVGVAKYRKALRQNSIMRRWINRKAHRSMK